MSYSALTASNSQYCCSDNEGACIDFKLQPCATPSEFTGQNQITQFETDCNSAMQQMTPFTADASTCAGMHNVGGTPSTRYDTLQIVGPACCVSSGLHICSNFAPATTAGPTTTAAPTTGAPTTTVAGTGTGATT